MGEDRTLAIAFCAICFAFGIGQLWATWFKPALQKRWIFKPRWPYGGRASRFGVTTQACVHISLGSIIASQVAGIDHRYALGAFLLSGAVSSLMWGIDVSSDFNAKR